MTVILPFKLISDSRDDLILEWSKVVKSLCFSNNKLLLLIVKKYKRVQPPLCGSSVMNPGVLLVN